MKKKLLISTVVLMLTVAMAVGFTTAQQQKMTTVPANYVTIGEVEVTCDPASGLVEVGPMAADGTIYSDSGKLTSTGNIKQDVYVGLCDGDSQYPGDLGDAVLVRVKIGGDVVISWTVVDDLFQDWTKIISEMTPSASKNVVVELKLDPTVDYASEGLMGVTHWFKVLLFAVNVGGTPPVDPPVSWSWWWPTPPTP